MSLRGARDPASLRVFPIVRIRSDLGLVYGSPLSLEGDFMQLFVFLPVQKVDVHVVLAFNVHRTSRLECVHFLQHWETVLWNLEGE